jgi:hypothetical protein
LCDMPHDQDHLASDMFINSTTIPLKRGSSSFCERSKVRGPTTLHMNSGTLMKYRIFYYY